MKRTASGRYVVYGGMDHPDHGEAREVGVLDLRTGVARRVALPTTCWHVAAHPTDDLLYALSFRVAPQDGRDYHEWGMSFFKEYVYEIDAETGEVVRHWTAGREVRAHINSDVTVSSTELIFCTGGSQSIVLLDLESFAEFRIVDERPDVITQARHGRAAATQFVDAFSRGSPVTNSRHFLNALRISRGSLLDSVYGCQLSADQTLIFTANRGLNTISVYDYPSMAVRLRVPMPELQEYDRTLSPWSDPRLGFHHSHLISPAGVGVLRRVPLVEQVRDLPDGRHALRLPRRSARPNMRMSQQGQVVHPSAARITFACPWVRGGAARGSRAARRIQGRRETCECDLWEK